MLDFREQLRKDAEITFFNLDEFGEEHIVNGREMKIIIDDNELSKRSQSADTHYNGSYIDKILVYVRGRDFGPLPGIEKVVRIDGNTYRVTKPTNELGVYSLVLERTQS